MAKRRLKQKSSFFEMLDNSRIVLRPADMIGEPLRLVENEALGVFMHLWPYVLHGHWFKKDITRLSRLAGVHVRTMRRLWPNLSQLFEELGGEIRLAPQPWFNVQTIPIERQRLRHLLDRLMSYWGNACAYCGAESGLLEIEHIVPVVRGGTDDLTNLTLACRKCNSDKRTKTAAEFGHPHIHDLAAKIQ